MVNGNGDDHHAGIIRNLQEAIGQLHRDLNRVEIWAGALTGFLKPVPEYRPANDFLLPRAEEESPEGGAFAWPRPAPREAAE